MRTYSELVQIPSFEERLKYAYIGGGVAELTFGCHRYLNQRFYESKEWESIRRRVILRDDGEDLGCKDRPIFKGIIIHHLEPITIDDIINMTDKVTNPDNLICVSFETHNFIHYGIVENRIPHKDRTPNDQCPWKQ